MVVAVVTLINFRLAITVDKHGQGVQPLALVGIHAGLEAEIIPIGKRAGCSSSPNDTSDLIRLHIVRKVEQLVQLGQILVDRVALFRFMGGVQRSRSRILLLLLTQAFSRMDRTWVGLGKLAAAEPG